MDSLDNHPIPQDVTHFQFRLIGDMTIKQFGYLAGCLGLAWFVFAVPFFILIKILFVPGFAFLGVLLAFIPIEGRPADLMLSKFMKALFIPNQFIFQKTSGNSFYSSLAQMPTGIQTIPIQTSQTPIQSGQIPPVQKQSPQKEQLLLQSAHPAVDFGPQLAKIMPVTPPQPIAQPLSQVVQPVPASQPVPTVSTASTKQLEDSLSQAVTQKEQLQKDLQTLRQQTIQQPQTPIIPAAPPPTVQESSHVKKIPPPLNKTAGAPMSVTDVPNLITGIVKDSRGNVLPNILIEVKDKEGNPVRAFKTNQLGQFASATPLLNGVYTVLFEDTAGKHKFDSIELTVDGTILLPIEIISIDQREELRKELFG